jgi:hypothetical protein
MTDFRIVRNGERMNDIVAGAETVARVINRDNGWFAYRVRKTERMSAMGPVYELAGDGVRVSNLINLEDGADRIAAELDLA